MVTKAGEPRPHADCTLLHRQGNDRRSPGRGTPLLRVEGASDRITHETTLGMDVLRCGTEAGVLKRLARFAICYNLVRPVTLEAGRRQGVPPEPIILVVVLRWLSSSPAGAALPESVANAHRPGRVGPRCRKRWAKKHTHMNRPRRVLRQRLLDQ